MQITKILMKNKQLNSRNNVLHLRTLSSEDHPIIGEPNIHEQTNVVL